MPRCEVLRCAVLRCVVLRRGCRDERGSAAPFALASLGLLLLLGAALGVVSALVHAHRAAQSAADLAALAAASASTRGEAACRAAERLAQANSAELTSCASSGQVVEVRVLVEGPRWLGQAGDLEAVARAGPAQGAGPAA